MVATYKKLATTDFYNTNRIAESFSDSFFFQMFQSNETKSFRFVLW